MGVSAYQPQQQPFTPHLGCAPGGSEVLYSLRLWVSMEGSSSSPRDSPESEPSLNRAIRKIFDYQSTHVTCNIAQLRGEQGSPNYVIHRLYKWQQKSGFFSVLIFMSSALMYLLKFWFQCEAGKGNITYSKWITAFWLLWTFHHYNIVMFWMGLCNVTVFPSSHYNLKTC